MRAVKLPHTPDIGPAIDFPVAGEPGVVQMIEACGEWWVRVIEDGKETTVNSFVSEEYAAAFADGQRMRLGLDSFTRV